MGHQPRKDGRINESCFSQWYVASFEINGINSPTAEYYMMVEKARLFGDSDIAARILACQSPAEAKKLGRAVRNFDSVIWDAKCFGIVVTANYHKFFQNPALRAFLLTTGNRILVEASPVDTIWEIGRSRDDVGIEDPHKWLGKICLVLH